ncbi:hypothetical protein L209DRAFT_771401 [Thermothelomyces heterothallicus CBS 203.75]
MLVNLSRTPAARSPQRHYPNARRHQLRVTLLNSDSGARGESSLDLCYSMALTRFSRPRCGVNNAAKVILVSYISNENA